MTEHLFPKIKEMYEKGESIKEIAKTLKICNSSIYNALSKMDIPKRARKGDVDHEEEKLVYADNKVVIKKITVNGKRYADITPLFAPR